VIDLEAHVSLRYARLRRRGAQTWLLAPDRGFVLGGSAPAIVALIDGHRTVGELVAELSSRAAAEPALVRRDVLALLEQLVSRGLVRLS
jgi:pyrroloquinoline quinone biosynthesis protein D